MTSTVRITNSTIHSNRSAILSVHIQFGHLNGNKLCVHSQFNRHFGFNHAEHADM